MKYRKKPVVIDALCFNNEIGIGAKIIEWAKSFDQTVYLVNSGIKIPTLEGTMLASRGDWIIRGVKGEFYPCKPDIFEATYEKVEENL